MINTINYLNHSPDISLSVHVILLSIFQVIPLLIIPTFIIRLVFNIQKQNPYLTKPWITPSSKINPLNFKNPLVMLDFIVVCLIAFGIGIFIGEGMRNIVGSGLMIIIGGIGFYLGIQNFIKRNPNLFKK